jgi:3-methyladenine DNA glycosylase AlkD
MGARRPVTPPPPAEALRQLRAEARPAAVAGMARFGMSARGRLGVSIPTLRRLAKAWGHDAGLAAVLWASGVQEARIAATMVADPGTISRRTLQAWVRDLDSWDVCDQFCLNLVARSPHAWPLAERWATARAEFTKRAAFATLAVLAVHDASPDRRFAAALRLVERAASDDRPYVSKGVNWALRFIGRRNQACHAAATTVARRLAERPERAMRWVGRDALRALAKGAWRGGTGSAAGART